MRQAFASTTVQNTLLAVWWGAPDVHELARHYREIESVCGASKDGAFLLGVITPSTLIPGPAAREALRAQFERVRGRLLALAVVMEKTGIEGTLSRTVLTTLLTLSRRPFAMKIFADRRSALLWLAERGARVSPIEGTAALQRLDPQPLPSHAQ